jgi:hypothetical protein
MELKNAVTVCLISLFSATLVLLIARTLDVQSAARLEPQLIRIAEELEGLRKQGGIAAAAPGGQPSSGVSESESDALFVYYFHSNTRCPTCRDIESQAHDAVHTDFVAELNSGRVVWKTLNYEQGANAELAKKFDIMSPIVILAKMQAGEIAQWKSLDEVWGLVGNKPAYAAFMRDQINKMLAASEPETQASVAEPPDSQVPADLPIPE